MLTRVQALVAALALTATASIAAPRAATKPATKPVPRCDVKINQIAASVHLNRTKAPPSVCVLGCDAKLVGVRKEGGRIAALAIYSGRRCLPAGSSKLPKKKPTPVLPKPKAKTKPVITAKAVKPTAPVRPADVARSVVPTASAK